MGVEFLKNFLPSRLRELRGDTSQSDFAAKIGVKQTSYSSWERGVKDPAAQTIGLIASTFGVSSDWLLGLSENQRGTSQSVQAQNNHGAIAIGGGNSVNRDCMECPLLQAHLKRFSTGQKRGEK